MIGLHSRRNTKPHCLRFAAKVHFPGECASGNYGQRARNEPILRFRRKEGLEEHGRVIIVTYLYYGAIWEPVHTDNDLQKSDGAAPDVATSPQWLSCPIRPHPATVVVEATLGNDGARNPETLWPSSSTPSTPGCARAYRPGT